MFSLSLIEEMYEQGKLRSRTRYAEVRNLNILFRMALLKAIAEEEGFVGDVEFNEWYANKFPALSLSKRVGKSQKAIEAAERWADWINTLPEVMPPEKPNRFWSTIRNWWRSRWY